MTEDQISQQSIYLLNHLEVMKARYFAHGAHRAVQQVRKFSGDDYFVHLHAVAVFVSRIPHATPAMVMAAYLHDTKEDTGVTLVDLRNIFGDEVADHVFWLSDVSKKEDGNRAFRKNMDCQHIMQAPPTTKSIKLADSLHNMVDIISQNRSFAKVYIPEKEILVNTALIEGDPKLFADCLRVIDDFKHGRI